MSFIIKRNDGAYVVRQGQKSSYTRKLQHARLWAHYEDAKRELCPENERIVAVDAEIYAEGTR